MKKCPSQFSKAKMIFECCSFCLTNTPKPQSIQVLLFLDREKQQTLTTEKLELENVCH